MTKPWLAILWFLAWGVFQAFAVGSVFAGHWTAPAAFPIEAYYALIYPDVAFIPLYFAAAILLWRGHWLGSALGLLAGGAVLYVLIYLLALSRFSGAINVTFDGLFLLADLLAVLQIAAGMRPKP